MKAVEGNISIADTVSVTGAEKKPVLQNPVKPGDAVVLTGDLYDIDPNQAYTKAQAITADMLRKCGVETVFVDVRTVPAKASEAITAGMYVEFSTSGFKKTASSGTTASDCIALTSQSTDDTIVIARK